MDIFDTLNSNFHENLCKCQINVNKSRNKSQINSIVNKINLNPVLTPRFNVRPFKEFCSLDVHQTRIQDGILFHLMNHFHTIFTKEFEYFRISKFCYLFEHLLWWKKN
jgi:hypothetical protein